MKPYQLPAILIASILLLCNTQAADAKVSDMVLSETVYSPLQGVEVKKVQSASNGEFLNYQVVKCDLTSPNLTLDILYPAEGGSTLKPTLGIARDNGAAAAMNADYFNRGSQSPKGSAVGYNQKNGVLLSNALEERVYSFSYRKDHQYSFDIFSNQIKIGFRDEVYEFVKTYNKYSSLKEIALYDRHWGKESLGSGGTLVELVIQDGILTEIRRDLPPVEIPENGYVIAGLSDQTTLFDQVQVGDKVTLEIITTPQLAFLPDFTVGGGSLLVDKGELVNKMSYPISSNAFPALGISEDGKTLWMITVVNFSKLSQKKMAEICQQEGAYYAINMDGGGSTQCVVKNSQTGELQYLHELSGGYERPIANAVGIISHQEDPGAYGILTEEVIAFPNLPCRLAYTVYDTNGDPMYVPYQDMTFTVTKGHGTVKDGCYYSEDAADATVMLSYHGVTKEVPITVVAPATHAIKNSDGNYTVTNPDGYTRTVLAEDYERGENIRLENTLPQTDRLTDNLGLSHTLSIYGGSKQYNTFFTRLLKANILTAIPHSCNPFLQSATANEWIEIVTLDNLEGRILNSRMTEWYRFLETLETSKNNIIICLEDPISFSRKQEENLFFDALYQAQKKR